MTGPCANFHEAFMRHALEQARRGWGTTHPNPMVGALERRMIKGHVRCVVFPLNKARILGE